MTTHRTELDDEDAFAAQFFTDEMVDVDSDVDDVEKALSDENGLYVCRPVANVNMLRVWARQHGIPLVNDPHVSIVYSKAFVTLPLAESSVLVGPTAFERIGPLGPSGAVVLFLDHPTLRARHAEAMAAGAVSEHPTFIPHLTLWYEDPARPTGLDVAALPLPTFPILLGPEAAMPLGTSDELARLFEEPSMEAVVKFDPSQPRQPKGDPKGGQFASKGKTTLHLSGAMRTVDMHDNDAPKPVKLSGFGRNAPMQSRAEKVLDAWWESSHPNPVMSRERLIGERDDNGAETWGGAELHATDNGVWVKSVRAITRGGGRLAMTAITEMADEHGARLWLQAVPLDAVAGAGKRLTTKKLRAWYKTFGFTDDPNDDDGMVREARGGVAKADHGQPREPKGTPIGGRFASKGSHLMDVMSRIAEPPLSADAERLITAWVGHPRTPTYDTGIMQDDLLITALQRDTPDVQEIRRAFAPVRETIRAQVGDTVRLYRWQARETFGKAIDADPSRPLSWSANPRVALHWGGHRTGEWRVGTRPPGEGFTSEFGEQHTSRRTAETRAADMTARARAAWEMENHDFYTSRGKPVPYFRQDPPVPLSVAWRAGQKADARAGRFLAKDIPVDDLLWYTNRAGQAEFLVRGTHHAVIPSRVIKADGLRYLLEQRTPHVIEALRGGMAPGDVRKADEQRLVSGWALVSSSADGRPYLDRQGEVVPLHVVAKAAKDFMAGTRTLGGLHVRDDDKKPIPVGDVREALVVTPLVKRILGLPPETPLGLAITAKVTSDTVWALVKRRVLRMFSIGGQATKRRGRVVNPVRPPA